MREGKANMTLQLGLQLWPASLFLIVCLGLLSCRDQHVGFEENVIAALDRAVLAIEQAGDESNAAFADGWIQEHQLAFTLSMQIAQDELQRLIRKDAAGNSHNCSFPEESASPSEGCELIRKAQVHLNDMREAGHELFRQLSWGHLRQAGRAMAEGDAAAADARRNLYRAQDFYVQHMQVDIVRSSERILHLAIVIIISLLGLIVSGLYFILQSRRQQQQLLERDAMNRDYTRKLEKIGREVRRLRDLGSAIDATAGVLIFNEQHKVVSINEGFRQLRGLAGVNVQGRSIISVMGLDDADFVESIIASVASKKIWRGEVPGHHEDGSVIWMYVLFYPELDDLEDFEGSLALVLDITESKKAQLILEGTRHLTALGEMAGGIAHEINNPLSVITGRVAILLKKFHSQSLDPEFLQSGLEQVQRTVSRIARIVDSMRRLSRADVSTEEARPETIENILRETMEFIEDKLKRYDIALSIHDAQSLSDAVVMLQGFGVSQILINLVGNAADAIESQPNSERWIRLELERSAEGALQIKVVDPGKGIPKVIQSKIMEPFFTTKPPGKGTGLGLSLSQRIAEEHGGRLYLDAEAAHTTFVLELPELKRQQEVA
jgi:PAS domain S-box-containing protein